MDKINIIFANRKNCFDARGGDTIQMEKTKEYLESLYPVNIKVCLSPDDILKDNESPIVHIFNIQTCNETKAFIEAAKKKNKKIVLSPIYWNLLDSTYIYYLSYFKLYNYDLPDFVKLLIIKFFNFFICIIPKLRKKHKNGIDKGLYSSKKNRFTGKNILDSADIIMPNSPEEMNEIIKYFGVDEKINDKVVTVPNAADFQLKCSNNAEKLPILFDTIDNFVLQVGRIEPIKNQLNTLRALINDKDIPLVFIGKPVDDFYYRQLKAEAAMRGNVHFINELSHDLIMKIYGIAKVHVLPSFRESPGLVSIEAKSLGCNIVTASEKFCPIKYYEFDKLGYICNPYNTKSIRHSIISALSSSTGILDETYKLKFSYKNVAKIVYDAYINLIKENNGSNNNISKL